MTIENRTGLVRREQVQTTTTVEEIVARGTTERSDPLDVSLRGRAFQASPAERMHYLQMLLDAGFGDAIAGQVAEAIAREMWASTMRPLPGNSPYVPPFYDAPAQALGQQMLEQFFVALGVPPQLATAAAQWFAQMIAPPQFYQPLWQGVGGRGDFNLDQLRQLMRGRGLEFSDGVQNQRLRNSMMIRPGAPRRARESADELVDRALRGGGRSPERRQRFDVDGTRRPRRSDPAADLLRARAEGKRSAQRAERAESGARALPERDPKGDAC